MNEFSTAQKQRCKVDAVIFKALLTLYCTLLYYISSFGTRRGWCPVYKRFSHWPCTKSSDSHDVIIIITEEGFTNTEQKESQSTLFAVRVVLATVLHTCLIMTVHGENTFLAAWEFWSYLWFVIRIVNLYLTTVKSEMLLKIF